MNKPFPLPGNGLKQWLLHIIFVLLPNAFLMLAVSIFTVSHNVAPEKVLTDLLALIQQLDEQPHCETALLILPSSYSEFDEYLSLLAAAGDLLAATGNAEDFQLASFHPQYCFDGCNEDDAANYTNRSPYPMLHLLREASVEKALENYSNPEFIPEKNIEYARQMGKSAMAGLLKKCY